MEKVTNKKPLILKFKNPLDKKTIKGIKKYKSIYVMMIPVLLYFIVFSYYPLALGIVQSFQKSKLIGAPEFTGFANYKEVLHNYQFRGAFLNSIVMGVGTQILSFITSLFVALGINEIKNKFAKSAVQTVSYLPNLFSWTVVGGMWVFVLSTNGLINSGLSALGLKTVQFMAEEKLGQAIMILTAAWKGVGYGAVLFLASIVSIDQGIFEAAQIDGASRLRQIFTIIIPNLVPTMKVILYLAQWGFYVILTRCS
jgi:putative aldouronate transport system permease protein